jgi:hypothetical protein
VSPHKRADPLGWPFGAIDPKVLAKLLRDRAKQQPHPVGEPAPF